jgi:hypothetical protein
MTATQAIVKILSKKTAAVIVVFFSSGNSIPLPTYSPILAGVKMAPAKPEKRDLQILFSQWSLEIIEA